MTVSNENTDKLFGDALVMAENALALASSVKRLDPGSRDQRVAAAQASDLLDDTAGLLCAASTALPTHQRVQLGECLSELDAMRRMA